MRKQKTETFERVCSRAMDTSEFLFGNDNHSTVAMLRNSKLNVGTLRLGSAIRFVTPIIIKASGNTKYFESDLTQEWNKFQAITFWGGSINSICNPQMAVQTQKYGESEKNDGSGGIRIRPWSDYTRSVDFEIGDEKVTLTISVRRTGEFNNPERMESHSLGELNSYIRFSFENPQGFDKIQKYYKIVISLIVSILENVKC